MLKRLLKVVLGAFIALTTLWTIGSIIHPPLLGVGLVLMGRGPDCSATQAIAGFLRRYDSKERIDYYSSRCKLVESDGKGFQKMDTPWGAFWEPAMQGTVVVPQLVEFDSKYAKFPGKPMRAGDIVLDCGANVGTFTRAALRMGVKQVIAIEPSPKNLECLRRNFAAEIASSQVIIYPKGVWDKDDELVLEENHETSAMDSVVKDKNSHAGIRVPLTTIDKLVAELKLPRVDFIKMDIEGAERQALRGAANTLRVFRPRLEMSVNHLPDDPMVIPALIRTLQPGYGLRCLLCAGDFQRWRVTSDILYFE